MTLAEALPLGVPVGRQLRGRHAPEEADTSAPEQPTSLAFIAYTCIVSLGWEDR